MVLSEIGFGTQGVTIHTKADEDEGKIIAFFAGLGILLVGIAIARSISGSKSNLSIS
jgi:hypothetical protein